MNPQYITYIHDASSIMSVSFKLLLSICITESHLTNTPNLDGVKSRSYGICQINEAHGSPKKLMNPKTNAMYAARILKDITLKKKGIDEIISAYSTGVNHTFYNNNYVNKVKLVYNRIEQRIIHKRNVVCLN